jgi:hypothetical protein
LGRGTECLFWSIYHVYNSLRVSVSVGVDSFLVELYFSYFFTRNLTEGNSGENESGGSIDEIDSSALFEGMDEGNWDIGMDWNTIDLNL